MVQFDKGKFELFRSYLQAGRFYHKKSFLENFTQFYVFNLPVLALSLYYLSP
jgi:hypothetical protein